LTRASGRRVVHAIDLVVLAIIFPVIIVIVLITDTFKGIVIVGLNGDLGTRGDLDESRSRVG